MESELRKAAETLRRMPIKPKRGFECGTERGIGFSEGYGCAIERLEALAVPVPTNTVRLAPWYEQREEQHKSHLVRGKKTLCGLDEWGRGNVDFKFGVEQGITSCVRCLRVLALEGLKAKTQPDAAVEAVKRVRFPNIYKYPCPEGWSVNDEDARKIVAAVRAADAEKAGAKP